MHNRIVSLLVGFGVLVLVSRGYSVPTPISSETPMMIPVSGIFVPPNGYDDNDQVQLIVDGELPNACWTTDRTESKLTSVSNQIVIQQFIRKLGNEVCKDEAKLPNDLKTPVKFMSEVNLGVLPKGRYNVVYSVSPEGRFATKSFQIDKAPTTEIDSLYYAITTDLYVHQVVSSKDPQFEVLFSGYLSNPCSELKEEVLELPIQDVIVLMPQVQKYYGTCLPVAKEFSRTVMVKTPAVGRYLLQIRSANGHAVNRLFTVQ